MSQPNVPQETLSELKFRESLINLMNLGSMDPIFAEFRDGVLEMRKSLESHNPVNV